MQKIRILALVIVGIIFFGVANDVKAACSVYSTSIWDSCSESCSTNADGRTLGHSCVAQTTVNGVVTSWKVQFYECDTPCGPGSNCFPAGTKVTMADGKNKNIEEITVGEETLGSTQQGKPVGNKVLKVVAPISDNMCSIKYTDGKRLEVTKSHPIYTSAGWKAIEPEASVEESSGISMTKLAVGDLVANIEKKWSEVASISCRSERVQTYNLSVDNTNTFFADGYLVHNKGCSVCTQEWKCKKTGPKNSIGDQCGWSNSKPQVMKHWYHVVVECHNICNVCGDAAPGIPTLNFPADGTQIKKGVDATFSWNAIAGWGKACTEPINSYNLCVSSGTGECDLVNEDTGEAELQSIWIPNVGAPNATWSVIADNGALTATSEVRNICIEGFDATDTNYLSAYGACDANHKHARTCKEDCGKDDCDAQVLVDDCASTITGTLFDASDLTDCSGMATAPKFGNEVFGINGTWPVISAPVSTNIDGVYTETVYGSAVSPEYSFDYTNMVASGRAAGVKLECQGPTAIVSGDGQTIVKDTGFWRTFGGWWQVVGGSVFAENGVASNIPASVAPATNQRLILKGANNKMGFLAHGLPWLGTELGSNTNAGVSEALWRIESEYSGLRYDYNFYKTRMDVFPQTEWNGDSISYDDQNRGYQIFKHTGNVVLNYGGPTGTDKVILLVDGDVRLNSDVDVPDGAFLSVIASGDITFDPAVTQAEGWFVAEHINVPCKQSAGACDKTDVQFNGQGSFVGWTGITLGRIQPGVENNTRPSELFTFRPDMVVNIPTPMKVFTRKFSPFVP